MVARRFPFLVLAALVVAAPAPALGQGCPTAVSTFGSPGSGPGQLDAPFGIALGDDGLLYVTDQHNDRVQVFDQSGTPVRSWPVPSSQPDRISAPTGICISNGVVWVTLNQDRRVTRWTQDGAFLGDATGPMGGYWVHPAGVSADANGNVYVCDSGYGAILVLGAGGSAVTGGWHVGGEPYGVMVRPEGTVYVSDYDGTVSRWTSEGSLLGDLAPHGTGPGQFSSPEGMALDPSGNLYVCDTGNRRVQVFDATDGYVCAFGSNGQALGQLYVPSGIAVTPAGDVFVVEFGNDRVQLFRYVPVATQRQTWGSLKTAYR